VGKYFRLKTKTNQRASLTYGNKRPGSKAQPFKKSGIKKATQEGGYILLSENSLKKSVA
jgi:hypothetical protein